jgi:nucleotide-binding universal stress UspA family protein
MSIEMTTDTTVVPQAVEANAVPPASVALPAIAKILVALDSHSDGRADEPQHILLQAIALAKQFQSQMMVMTCLPDTIPAPTETASGLMGMGMYGLDTRAAISIADQHFHHALQEQEKWLQNQCELVTRQGIPTEWDSRQGEPGSQICNLARSWNADLIIVGRRGRSGLTEMLLGSVSNYVLHHAPCSVMVVQ